MKKSVFSGNLQGMVWLACVKHSLKPCTTWRLRSIKQLPEHWRRHGSHLGVTVILHQTDYVVINLSANIKQLQQQCAYSFLPLPSPPPDLSCPSNPSIRHLKPEKNIPSTVSSVPDLELTLGREETESSCVSVCELAQPAPPALPRSSALTSTWHLGAFLVGLGAHSAQRHWFERIYPEGRDAFPEHGSFQLGLQECFQHVRMFTE